MAEDATLRSDRMPRHVAIIMDGNGRWAEARGLARNAGHRAGIEAVRNVLRAANDLNVRYLTLYAFSSENWGRPQDEVRELMRLLEHYLVEEIDEVMRNGICLRSIGRIDRLPSAVTAKVRAAVERTRNNREMVLVFALSYGGRAEIVDTHRRPAVQESGYLAREHQRLGCTRARTHTDVLLCDRQRSSRSLGRNGVCRLIASGSGSVTLLITPVGRWLVMIRTGFLLALYHSFALIF